MNEAFVASHSCGVGSDWAFFAAKIEAKVVGGDANNSEKVVFFEPG